MVNIDKRGKYGIVTYVMRGGTDNEFACKDPRGIVISCSKQQWEYLVKQREMEGQQGVVKAILEAPDFINQSRDFKDRHTYYKQLVLHSVGNTYIRVVVKVKSKILARKRGYVINAFSCSGTQKGERLLWKRNK